MLHAITDQALISVNCAISTVFCPRDMKNDRYLTQHYSLVSQEKETVVKQCICNKTQWKQRTGKDQTLCQVNQRNLHRHGI